MRKGAGTHARSRPCDAKEASISSMRSLRRWTPGTPIGFSVASAGSSAPDEEILAKDHNSASLQSGAVLTLARVLALL